MSAAAVPVTLLFFLGACSDADPAPRGIAALQSSCTGVLAAGPLKEAGRSEKIEKVRVPSGHTKSYSSAARTLLRKQRTAEVCNVPFSDDARLSPGSPALRIQFDTGDAPLFPRNEQRSTSGYTAYGLASGMQATSEAQSSDILFSCTPKGYDSPVEVTGNLYDDLDLSERSRFRTLFRASEKMIRALKCGNKIALPNPDKMRPFPKK
ncbi:MULTISPECIES: hypothetical protein [unclassified Streptomyces]|uniref:hypothetical protein n=1 Tax=unclassified Streptomyces TaxID=2593676 RepID=UPI00340AD322